MKKQPLKNAFKMPVRTAGCFIIFFMFWLMPGGLVQASSVSAASDNSRTGTDKDYTDDFMEQLDLSEIEQYLKEQDATEEISFYELIKELATGNFSCDGQKLTQAVGRILWGELQDNKAILVTVLLLAISCAFLKNFSDIFHNTYISEVCFFLIYMEMTVLLLQSYQMMSDIVVTAMNQIVDFMNMLIPVFGMSLAFSMANFTAAGFYQIAFIVVYIVQWGMLACLVPMTKLFIMMEFMNYMIEGERFSRMCELMEEIIRWCLKCAIAATIGLNVVQTMVVPVIDRLKMSTVTKTIGMIPGMGNITGAVSELMLGAGMVIKNSVGTAGVLILLLLVMFPLCKMFLLSLMYKVTAAVTEPVSDKRIAGSMNGICLGCQLLTRILLTSLVLFLVTIAMITAISGFLMG